MSAFLLKLLELSLQAGALTVAILLVRLVFRRLPAKYLCVLWAIVAVRLVVPFSIETGFAWAPDLQTLWSGEEKYEYREIYTEFIAIKKVSYDSEGNVIEHVVGIDSDDEVDCYIGSSQELSGDVTDIYVEVVAEHVTAVPGTDANDETDYFLVTASPTPVPEGITNVVFKLDWRGLFASVTPVLFGLWLLGMVLLLGYGAFSCLKVMRLVKKAIPYEDNIWLCEGLETPFLFGWRHPQIYLPTNLEEDRMKYVILHEKAHIVRRDNYFKLIGYLLLTVYWFNPLIWVAYVMFCKDVERACDEKVIGGLDGDGRKGYAEALLECCVDRKFIISNPLAFGEMDVKKRITGILKYKKPGKWVIAVTMLFCITAVAGCFFVKKEDGENTNRPEVTPTVAADATPTHPPRGDGPYTPIPTPTQAISKLTPTPTEYVWTQVITHIPSDVEHLASDWDLIGNIAPETLVTVPAGQTTTVDLNGDGVEESVTYDVENLFINEEMVLQCGTELFGIDTPYDKSYYIFDIDLLDGYKEIGLREMGPNGDVGIHLYRYDAEQLQPIGGFRNVPQNGEELAISVPGDGTVWTVDRDFLLETCNVVKKHQLENATAGMDARLVQARRGHYVFLGWDWEGGAVNTTAACEFKAFVSDCLDDERVVIVPEGSEITFYDYYLSHEEWGRGYVRFFYSVDEKWDSTGWLILSSEGIIMPRSLDTEPIGNAQPEELFDGLNYAG